MTPWSCWPARPLLLCSDHHTEPCGSSLPFHLYSYTYSYPNPACKGLGFCLRGEKLALNCDGCSWQTERKHSLLSLWVFLPHGLLHSFFTLWVKCLILALASTNSECAKSCGGQSHTRLLDKSFPPIWPLLLSASHVAEVPTHLEAGPPKTWQIASHKWIPCFPIIGYIPARYNIEMLIYQIRDPLEG